SPYPLVPTNPTGFRPASALATAPLVLQGGESRSGALIFPLNYRDDAGLDEAWAQRAYAEARQYWQDLTILRLPIHLPDQDLMDMVTACARNILQAREIENGLPVFKVGPTCYRSLFVVDGHFLLEAAMYLGLQEDAYRGVDTLLRRVHPDGSISEMPYHSKETGISLFTMVRQCELMKDDPRLFTLWPVIRDAVGYIEQLREQAYALPVDSPCHGLMPEAYADGGLGGKRGEYTTVFWTLAGLKAAAQTADRLGMVDDAQRFHQDFDSLMADYRRHAARDMQRLPDGTPYLPMWKSYSGDHNWIPHYPRQTPAESRLTPASATWALCQAIYPGEVFDAQDELVQNLLHLYDLVDDEEGIPALTGWLPYQSLWNYNASFGAHVWLYAGRPDKALDYLYAFANHASPTRVWREEQSLKATGHGQLFGDMPHNWASAEFIRLVRHLVVFERGDDLELLPGVPAAWRKPGDVIHFGDTPTRFGPVSLRLETGDRGAFTLDIGLDLSYPIQPRTIKVKLQSREVKVNGQPIGVDPEGWAQLPVEQAIHLVGVWQH
ncbi:MAG: hypothetical protein HY835_11955, partial [Anaerolineae bacterium]|nr:hypothetical protein [Anaerolineae bacterium]